MAKKKNKNTGRNVAIGAIAAWLLLGSSRSAGGSIVSKHYTIEDVQKSDTAVANNVTEQFEPLDPEYAANANIFIKAVLDPLSDALGGKLDIDSWWRSQTLNGYITCCGGETLQGMVGGEPDSFHLKALAADFDDPTGDNRRVVKAMYDLDLPFTEMILYNSWQNPTQIHLAYDPMRGQEKQLLLKTDAGYTTLHPQPLLTYYNAAGVTI